MIAPFAYGLVRLRETINIAFTSLGANRLRALLTMLGIVIGITAVCSMITIGRGVGTLINAQFSQLGATRLTVFSATPANPQARAPVPLSLSDVEALADAGQWASRSIALVSPEYSVGAQIATQGRSVQISVVGVAANYPEAQNWGTSNGRFITPEDIEQRARVAVLGTSTVRRLFGSEQANPIGLPITINDRVFTVVGVMAQRTNALSFEPNAAVFVPISTAQTRLANALTPNGSYQVSQITVLAADQSRVDTAVRDIRATLRRTHRITDAPAGDDFQIENFASTLSAATRITGLLSIFLAVIGGISLLVGGIGVMNIMLVSVTERTREIGLRKAVGAEANDILTQFLVESAVLCLAGGAVGIGLTQGLVALGSALIPSLTLVLTADVVLLALGVSTAIGIGFGLLPANRAARMHPIQALRFE